MKWFKDFKGLFNTERVRTIVKVRGNRLEFIYLDYSGQATKFKEVKFKNSTKLKKFWEKYVPDNFVNYDIERKLFYSTKRLRVG